MYKRTYLLVSLVLLFAAAKAQPALDTIKDCLKEKPRVFAKLDTRNSFISNSSAKIFGVKMGLNYGHRLLIGIGYNQLYPPAKDFDQQLYYTDISGSRDSVTSRLRMYYISIYMEYIFYQTKHWSLGTPLQLGVGKTYYVYELYDQKRKREENMNIIYEPGVSVSYKFVKWFGIGADIGFRFMVTGDKRINQKFNAPTYTFKILIYYGEIYKMIFPNKKKKK